jgi:hypothetical protein
LLRWYLRQRERRCLFAPLIKATIAWESTPGQLIVEGYIILGGGIANGVPPQGLLGSHVGAKITQRDQSTYKHKYREACRAIVTMLVVIKSVLIEQGSGAATLGDMFWVFPRENFVSICDTSESAILLHDRCIFFEVW